MARVCITIQMEKSLMDDSSLDIEMVREPSSRIMVSSASLYGRMELGWENKDA